MKHFAAGALAFAFAVIATATTAHAGPTLVKGYSISNYKDGDANHGLWTGSNPSVPNPPYFKIATPGTLNIFEESGSKFAEMKFFSTNSIGITADIDLRFDGYSATLPAGYSTKNGGGGDPSTWEYFTEVSGTITIDDAAVTQSGYTYLGEEIVDIDVVFREGLNALQIGWGANDKDSTLGASVWLANILGSNTTSQGSFLDAGAYGTTNHWDINLSFVPEPSSFAMAMVGLAALAPIRRRRR